MFVPSLCSRRNSAHTNTNTQTHAHTQIHTTQKRTFLSMKTQCSRIILTSKFERSSSSLCECVNIALVLKLSEITCQPILSLLCNIRVPIIYWHWHLGVLVYNCYGKPISLPIWAFFFLKSCILMLPFQANFLLNKCFGETESISSCRSPSKKCGCKSNSTKSTQQQPTTNIFLICYPRNEKLNSHTILNSDALSTDDALSR